MALLRLILLVTTIFLNSVVPDAGTHESYTGVDAFFNTVVPSLTPIIFMVLLLDALMSRVMIDGKNELGQIISRRNSNINLVLALSLVLFWSSYYLELLGG